jgi:hypothetical protein
MEDLKFASTCFIIALAMVLAIIVATIVAYDCL